LRTPSTPAARGTFGSPIVLSTVLLGTHAVADTQELDLRRFKSFRESFRSGRAKRYGPLEPFVM